MKRTLTALACAAAVAVTATACGSEESADATGGLTGEPVLIGVQAPMEGPAAYPQTGYGAQAAEKYINEELGGIGGRPVKIQLCAGDNSPETAINCANEFVSSNVVAVLDAPRRRSRSSGSWARRASPTRCPPGRPSTCPARWRPARWAR
jgi:branched-chain amino acid transport system substrate-binding protein